MFKIFFTWIKLKFSKLLIFLMSLVSQKQEKEESKAVVVDLTLMPFQQITLDYIQSLNSQKIQILSNKWVKYERKIQREYNLSETYSSGKWKLILTKHEPKISDVMSEIFPISEILVCSQEELDELINKVEIFIKSDKFNEIINTFNLKQITLKPSDPEYCYLIEKDENNKLTNFEMWGDTSHWQININGIKKLFPVFERRKIRREYLTQALKYMDELDELFQQLDEKSPQKVIPEIGKVIIEFKKEFDQHTTCLFKTNEDFSAFQLIISDDDNLFKMNRGHNQGLLV